MERITSKVSAVASNMYFMCCDETPTNKLHRFDGPAVIWSLVENQWFINDNEIDGKVYQQWLLDNGMDINNLSEEDESLIMVAWG